MSEDDSIHLSQEGTVAGSPLYMAPEQVMHNQPPDRPTDIYGLGAVAYFMLTGRPPFLGDTAMEVMVAHARDPVTPPSQLRPDVPADLEAVVLRCLAKNPEIAIPTRRASPRHSIAAPTPRTGRPSIAAEWWRTHLRQSADPAATATGLGASKQCRPVTNTMRPTTYCLRAAAVRIM